MVDDPNQEVPSEDELKQVYFRRVDQQLEISARISETTRFIGFGIIAWVFVVNTSSSDFSIDYVKEYGFFVGLAGILGVLGVLSDYAQYVCAHNSTARALDRENEFFSFDEKSGWYFFQDFFWKLKQGCILFSGAVIAVTFAIHLVCRSLGC